MLSTKMYYQLNVGHTKNVFEDYLYKDPTDDRYLNGRYGSQSGGYYKRVSNDLNIKGDFVWQVNNNHNIKAGFQNVFTHIENKPLSAWNTFRNSAAYLDSVWYDIEKDKVYFKNEKSWNLELLPDSAVGMDRYTKDPINFSAYIQDKMEFEELTNN